MGAKCVKVVKGEKFPVIKKITHGMKAIVNNAELHIWKLLRAWILKVLFTRKKILLTMVTDVFQTFCGDHLAIYTNIKSLWRASETNIMLYANYISVFIKDASGCWADNGLWG